MRDVWVEKYRPKTLNDVILQNTSMRKKFQSYVTAKELPNLMVHGIQGTGKTSLFDALLLDMNIDPMDIIRVRCSDDKIDAIRNRVTSFAYTFPIGDFKVVRLEEFDYLSPDGQALLRSLIEDTSSNCRFLATCNYSNKVMPPLRSRFQEFEFRAPDVDEVIMRMAHILDAENVTFDPDVLMAYVSAGYPDVRKTIQLLEQNVIDGKLNALTEVDVASDWKLGLIAALQSNDIKLARKTVCENATREDHEGLFRFMYENLGMMPKFADATKYEEGITIIAEHLYRHSFVADTEINIAAMFIALGAL